MIYLEIILKIVVGLSILNVWLLRANKATPYRGGNAGNIKEEFMAFGLPNWFMVTVGTVKVGLALVILASIYFSSLELIGSIGMAMMMLGSISMHLKVGSTIKQVFPAILFFLLSALIVIINPTESLF